MSRKQRITDLLTSEFKSSHLEVLDESHGHSVPKGAESHFKVVMVCESFQNMSKVKRHQTLYKLMDSEFAAGLHALSLHLYTAEEWQGQAPASPPCAGGSK
ncbi:BolA family protein [Teredinibacter sp. KSP-S5-2]|uniref:BolA family protein n=1 Tax=Teredinibacter sp. KSP-S5-2 TaxID=3034506 RepID=UPI00293500F5|nr:BolA/IbaG family iron-sulfur metabolism protein [Teredinibacter sp. KSP-S5-2]WNO07518.1 BolA/IbaG family iron-sulfur metabolism protein [Teredinibacter sp. KSP-S5-2]